MKQFLITLLAVIIGGIILLLLPLILLIMIGSVASSLVSSSETSEIRESTILTIDLSKPIVDYNQESTYSIMQSLLSDDPQSASLNDVLNNISAAATDSRIKALMITGSANASGFSALSELRRAILLFKESGKPVYFFANSATTGTMYVASIADSVFVTPKGNVDIHGFHSQKLFFLKLAHKLGIDFDVIKHGKYKSAVEPFFRTDMSPEDREQTQRIVDVLWSETRDSIAAARNISADALDAYVNNLNFLSPIEEAQKIGLIDRTIYKDEFIDLLRKITNTPASEEVYALDVQNYTSLDYTTPPTDKIAIIYAQGEIVDGNETSDNSTIYGDDLRQTLAKVRKDKNIRAAVLRVNSPGGSASASDIIWREVKLFSQEKPIVVSMGDYAASGGYYISCAANYIVAEPTTLTGSIGVYGFVPNVEDLTKDAGISTEIVSSNDIFVETGYKRLPQEMISKLYTQVDDVYTTFVSRVADGRSLSTATVDSLGGGRVWMGKDAVSIGLVDTLGGIDDALFQAAELAGLDDYDVALYPEQDDSPLKMFRSLTTSAKTKIGESLLGSHYKDFQRLRPILESDPTPQILTITTEQINF